MPLPELGWQALQHFKIWKQISSIWDAESQSTCLDHMRLPLERKTGMKKAWEEHNPNPSEMDFTGTWFRMMEGNVKSHLFMGFSWFMIFCWKKSWTSHHRQLIADIKNKNYGAIKIFLIWLNQTRLELFPVRLLKSLVLKSVF